MSNIKFLSNQKLTKDLRFVHAQLTLLNYRTGDDPIRGVFLTAAHRRQIQKQLRRDLKASLRAILRDSKTANQR